MMCEKEGFISHVIKGAKKSDRSGSETLPLSHVNSQRLSYRTDETCDAQKPVLAEMYGNNPRRAKLSKAQTSQQQVSPTDEEIDCLLQKTGFLDEKGWSKFLGGNFMRASVVSFTVICCLLAMLNGALVAGYVSSVITTIEKRFDIGSFYSGMVAASVEMGGAASVIFVSYFGSSRHIPGWIGLGAALTGFGALVFTLPHVMAPAYTVTGGLNSSTGTESICRPKQVQNLPISSSLVSGIYSVAVDPLCDAKLSSPLFYVLVLVVAQLLIGIGGSPLYTLGTTYIDNHVSRMKAPSYIAFIYACGVFGPIAGFGLGALMLQYYVDLLTFDITALNLTPNNPKWVGAWWGGFVFIGALLLLVSVPFYGFPKILVSELKMLAKQDRQKFFSLMEVFNSSQKSEHPLRPPPLVEASDTKLDPDSVDRDKSSYGKNIRDIPGALLKIFKNPVYFVTSLGICCEVSVVSGFVFFLPKYLESEFGASKIMASLLTGGIAIPGAVIGILMGGHCLRHCQLTSKGAIQLTLALNSIALAGFGLFFVLGCDNVKIAGVTVPYDNHSHYNSLSSYVSVNSFNLSSTCNRHCSCDDNNLDLVCGADEVMFFSPCHAGCMQVGSSNPAEQNYTNCSCAREYDSDGTAVVEIPGKTLWVRSASGGACQHVCGTLIPFMVMLFIMTFVIAGTQMPLLMVTIRSVGEQEKALALGLQFVMLRLFAYIPAPIMYGWQIDQTCIFWTKTCGTLGNCLVYDLVQLRYKFVGISFAYKFFAATFYLSIWIILWMRHDKTLKDGDAESSKRMSLVIVEETNVLCPTLDFQPPPKVEAKSKGTREAGNSLKKSYESMGAYSAAGRSHVEEESSERDESVETTLDASDCGDVSKKNGEICDEASLKVMKQFDSFPLIDDDDLEGKVDNRRRNASQQVPVHSPNFQDSFHKFPIPTEAVRVGQEETKLSW